MSYAAEQLHAALLTNALPDSVFYKRNRLLGIRSKDPPARHAGSDAAGCVSSVLSVSSQAGARSSLMITTTARYALESKRKIA
jgi:hypothetical protein